MESFVENGIDMQRPPAMVIDENSCRRYCEPSLSNYEQIASYNWLGTPSNPIMVIPGAPKVYKHWPGGRLKRETEMLMVNESHYMTPVYPMESLFQAVKICSSENNLNVKFQQYDVVCDRNVLVKLYSILDGNDEQRERFRTNVHRIGRTVVFVRSYATDKELLPSKVAIYGRDFVRRSTYKTHSLTSGSHRQIVSYDFGGLKYLVRFQVNCVESDPLRFRKSKIKWSQMLPRRLDDSTLSVVRWGTRKTYRLMELTTRLSTRPFPPFVWPQMYFGGTSSVAIGWHFSGRCTVESHSLQDVESQLDDCSKELMTRLSSVVEKIVQFVRTQPDTASFALIWEPFCGKQLKLYEICDSTTKVLPESLEDFVRDN